jgi:integrase
MLRWGQIDLMKRTLTVGRSKTECGSGRIIPLNRIAYAVLLHWAENFPKAQPEHYVFPSCENARIDTKHPNASNIDATEPIKSWRTAWRRALEVAGLKIRFHDLRHCCITKLAETQVSELTLMAIAGHMSRAMVEHYSHIRMAAKRAALDGIGEHVKATDIQTGVNQNVHQPKNSNSGAPANPFN